MTFFLNIKEASFKGDNAIFCSVYEPITTRCTRDFSFKILRGFCNILATASCVLLGNEDYEIEVSEREGIEFYDLVLTTYFMLHKTDERFIANKMISSVILMTLALE